MALTMKAEYAILLLVYLACEEDAFKPVPASEVAERIPIPETLVSQISACLSSRGWITGKRGAGGGIMLAVPPEEISVLDVLKEVEGTFTIKKCLEVPCERRDDCHLYDLWFEAQKRLDDFFDGVTIKDLADKYKG